MLNFTGSLRVFLGVEPVDLRKSFSGLLALVMNRLKEDPLQGALFVFSNRSRSRLKMLYWDGTGLWVLVKRLEKGTFAWPAPAETRRLLRASGKAKTVKPSGRFSSAHAASFGWLCE
jgi:transposase